MFADDGIVEDPIGPSHFDPEGKGHRGKVAIAAFWDKAIAPTDKIEFNFVDTYQCGDEEANVGNIVITAGGSPGDGRGSVHLPGRCRRQDGGAARLLGGRPRDGQRAEGLARRAHPLAQLERGLDLHTRDAEHHAGHHVMTDQRGEFEDLIRIEFAAQALEGHR